MSIWVPRYPEHVTHGGLMRVCFSVTPGMAVSIARELRSKVVLRF